MQSSLRKRKRRKEKEKGRDEKIDIKKTDKIKGNISSVTVPQKNTTSTVTVDVTDKTTTISPSC